MLKVKDIHMLVKFALVFAVATAPLMATEKPAEALTPQAPGIQSCVHLRDIDQTQVLDDKTIIFKLRGNKYFKNTLPYKCSGLNFEKSFSYRTSLSQLCSVDTITVLRTGNPIQEGPTCGLGKFEPYTPTPKIKK
jgi:hypothetical protein